MPKYKFLEGIVTADLAFEATGKTLNELFTNAALAVLSSQVKLATVTPKVTKQVKLKAKDTEELLFDFLNEIIYLKDAERLLFKTVKVKVNENKLTAQLKGEKINLEKHKLGNDLKAVTMHKFKLEKTKAGWKCRVVIDI